MTDEEFAALREEIRAGIPPLHVLTLNGQHVVFVNDGILSHRIRLYQHAARKLLEELEQLRKAGVPSTGG